MSTETSNKNQLPEANVICIKWGEAYYKAEHVNQLYEMIKHNVHNHKINFYCFTEIADGLNKDIIVKPLPVLNCDLTKIKPIYRKEVGLCDDQLGGLNGQRVFFFDLDVIVTGSLDEMFDYPKNDEFVIINDWNTKGDHVGQASCYSWQVGTLGFAKEYFENNHQEVIKKFYTASQEYLSSKAIEKWGKLNFWPETWFSSFKVHCIPNIFKRKFVAPKLPEGTKVLAFHGKPKMEDAILGRWAEPGKEPKWKILLYKSIKPSPWIKDFFYDVK